MEDLLTFKEAKGIAAELSGEDDTSDSFRSTVILLLSGSHGADRVKIQKLTQYDFEFMNFVADNFERTEIWKDGVPNSETGWEGEAGAVELATQALVGIGLLDAPYEDVEEQ